MKRINTSPISGMQELLPPAQAVFNNLKRNIEEVYHLHGFQNIETPTLDRTEILLAKAGGDTEKQIYKVVKTAETENDADQALRFDHTVPLARYVVEHESDLPFPFKVSQIGRNFRGERPQKGRFREFYQCDVDVVGRETLPVAYDADVIATLYSALKTFDLPDLQIRISNRKLLSGLLAALGLEKSSAEIFSIIDHAEKVPPETTVHAFQDLSIDHAAINTLLTFMQISGDRETVLEKLQALEVKNETFEEGINELSTVLELLEQSGLGKQAHADLLIVRGLDYYTGTVFETFLKNHRRIGSVASGGRYENLTGFYSDQHFPGVGGSIGLTRLFYVLNEHKLLKSQENPDAIKPLDLALLPLSEQEYPAALKLADELREKNLSVDVFFSDKKIGDKFRHAARVANYAVVVGADEVKTGNYEVKNLATREQQPLETFLKSGV